MSTADVVLTLPSDGDVLLDERLTRSLRAELASINGVHVEFAKATPNSALSGAKGSPMADVALWLFLGTTVKSGAQVLIEAIRAWSARHQNRTVRVTRGETTYEIPGNPDPAQERLVRELLEGTES